MSSFLQMIVARAKERSTWLGLIGLVSAFGVAMDPDKTEAIVTLGVAIGGVIAIFTKDKLPPAQ